MTILSTYADGRVEIEGHGEDYLLSLITEIKYSAVRISLVLSRWQLEEMIDFLNLMLPEGQGLQKNWRGIYPPKMWLDAQVLLSRHNASTYIAFAGQYDVGGEMEPDFKSNLQAYLKGEKAS